MTDNLGIHTIGELAQTDPAVLEAHFKSFGKLIWENANEIGSHVVESESAKAKGVGNSMTLAKDAADAKTAKKALLSLAETVQLSFFNLAEPLQNKNERKTAGPSKEKLEKLDRAMDSIKKRYGDDAVVRGSFLKNQREEGK